MEIRATISQNVHLREDSTVSFDVRNFEEPMAFVSVDFEFDGSGISFFLRPEREQVLQWARALYIMGDDLAAIAAELEAK